MTMLTIASLAVAWSLNPVSTDMGCLASLLKTIAVVEDDSGKLVSYYGDDGGRLHRLELRDGLPRETAQVGIPSAARCVAAADVDGNGTIEVVVAGTNGQFLIYHGTALATLWRGQEERYSQILAMAVANVDQDPALEILLLADGRLVVYDGSTHFKEWTSPEPTTASDLLVADVDGDGEVEIVLSSGVVLSMVFFQTKWDSGEEFGRELFLADVTGDGTPEILARTDGGTLRIFSAKERREVW